MSTTLKNILPGLILSVLIAILAKLGALFLPSLGAGTLSILLGIILGNLFFQQSIWKKGTTFSEKTLLEWSIVLLGMSATFQTIATIGVRGMSYILLQMSLTIFFIILIGRKMLFSQAFTFLMAGGNAVCGSSAIGAISPAIDAKDNEKGQAIMLVNLLGTLMMLTLPIVGTFIYHDDVLLQSALIGGTLQSVGQVIASASMLSPDVVELATIFKIMRIILLVVVVALFSHMSKSDDTSKSFEKKHKKKRLFPWYITGFISLCIINSYFHLPDELYTISKSVSSWFEITALAAIGLKINAKQFLKEGPKFMIFSLSIGITQIILAIILIYVLFII